MRRMMEDLNWVFVGWLCAVVALAAAICGEMLAFVVFVVAMNGCWVLRLWLDDRFYKEKRREADARRERREVWDAHGLAGDEEDLSTDFTDYTDGEEQY